MICAGCALECTEELHRCLDLIAVAEREWQAMKDTLDRSQEHATLLLTHARIAEQRLADLYADLAKLRSEMARNAIGPIAIERWLDRILASNHPSPQPTESPS